MAAPGCDARNRLRQRSLVALADRRGGSDWATNPGDPGYTWDPNNPLVAKPLASRIDYIFVGFPTRSGALRPTAARRFGTLPHNSVWPSDHYGVAIDLEVVKD